MTAVPVVTPSSPYRGLAAFEDSDLDALLFFGRERETEVIAANVIASRFTVLYGPLGVGKSSVLRAGVVRRLRALAPDAVVVVHDSWPGDAAAGLLRAVTDAVGVEPLPAGVSLAEGLAELAGRSPGGLYLVLDQFEELFVYPGSTAFAASLAEVVTRPDLRVHVLLALREDALSELDVFTGRIPNVFGNYLALERLDRASARAAVVGPIERYNELSAGPPVGIEDELVAAVLDQVEAGRVLVGGLDGEAAGGPRAGGVEAPYLQLVMERLWEAEAGRGSRMLRRETLDELGGAQAVVRAHLGEAVQALAPGQRDVAARVFNHLVAPSGTKIAHGAQDLAEYAGVDEEEIRPVLASLGASRILRPVDGRFEIYHDVLAGAVLAWRARHEGELALERQRAEAERRHRRLLALLAASLVVLGVVAAVAVYALSQRAEARDQAEVARAEAQRAQASRLAAEASVLIPVTQAELDSELALALAAEAARLAPTARAVNTLRRALLVSTLRAVVPEDGVAAASFSPDGTRIAVGTEGGAVAIYADDARSLLTALQVGSPVTSVSFSPDGEQVLTTESGGPARIWEAGTGAMLRSVGDAPAAASFSPDGSLVLTVEPGGARVWSAADGAAVAELNQPEAVREASFGPDGDLVATVGADSVARVFDARTGEPSAAVAHGDGVTAAVITPDGGSLVTTGRDGIARVWSLEDEGRLVHELAGHRGPISGGAVTADGSLLVTTGADGTARSWELATGRPVAVLSGHAGRVNGVAFSPDSLSVVTWGSSATARVGSPGSPAAEALLAGHGDGVAGASFHPSGEVILTTGADGRARLWRARVEAEFQPLAQVPAPVSAAEFSGDGSAAAVAGPNAVELLGTAEGRRVGTVAAPEVSMLAVGPDGSLVAEAREDRISVWRVGTDEPELEVDAEATALALGPDALAAGLEDGSIAVWSLDGLRVSNMAGPGGRVTAVGLDSAAGRLAAGFDDGTLAAWSLSDGRLLYERREHRTGTAVTSVAFSADGSRLVTAGGDSTARVWDASAGRVLYTLRGHYGTVRSAAFSPNGDWIVTAATAAAGLWDSSTRQRLLLLQADVGRLAAASFDATGLAVLVAGSDGTLSSYSCEVCGGVADLLALADRRLAATGRELTSEERRHYLDEE
jgi:WD40 repeat protein